MHPIFCYGIFQFLLSLHQDLLCDIHSVPGITVRTMVFRENSSVLHGIDDLKNLSGLHCQRIVSVGENIGYGRNIHPACCIGKCRMR